ncbi:hypothetical protein SNE40_010316 [Patella caerulea]|uniref:Uncharacterized protein n=1 Tax=Patella caerulea TaxID=87958 RepID=A0AAN8JT96_PATCE
MPKTCSTISKRKSSRPTKSKSTTSSAGVIETPSSRPTQVQVQEGHTSDIISPTQPASIPVISPLPSGNIFDSLQPVESASSELGLHVSHTLKQRIVNGDYVDLCQLLSRPPHQTEPGSPVFIYSEGHLKLKLQPKTLSLYLTAHPQAVQGLLKYMHLICLGSQRVTGLAWKSYDEQYRLKKAANPTTSWGEVDQELWLLCMFSNTPKPFATGALVSFFWFLF